MRDKKLGVELVVDIRRLLESLTNTYLFPISGNAFPSVDELNSLQVKIVELYKLARKKSGSLSIHKPRWKVFIQVEKRFPQIKTTSFCYKLLKKIEAAEPSPLYRITEKLRQIERKGAQSADVGKLTEILKLLEERRHPPRLRELDWKDCHQSIIPFVSQDFYERLINWPSGEQEYAKKQQLEPFHGLVGYCAMIDIWEQVEVWQANNQALEDSRGWLDLLRSEEIDSRLRAVSMPSADALTPSEYRRLLKKKQERTRKRVQRLKSKEKTCKKSGTKRSE